MGLEPMTSPLPRECSTTELHQHCPTNPTILPRTQVSNHYAKCKKTKKHPSQRPDLTRLHRLPGEQTKQNKYPQRDKEPSAAGRTQIHKPLHSPTTENHGAQGRIRTSVRHRRADLQSAAINHSATCASSSNPARLVLTAFFSIRARRSTSQLCRVRFERVV